MREDIPLFHLLKTINGYYCYDTNTNQIFPVAEKTYRYLAAVKAGDELFDPENRLVAGLVQDGYLSGKKVKILKHPASDTLDVRLSRGLEKVTLQLTQSCNLRCSYCVYSEKTNEKQRSHTNAHMSEETALKAVDFLLEHSVDSQRVNIGFYGGEPLLRFETIKKVVAYANEKFAGKKPSYYITTNGTLLTEEIIEYFMNNDINTLISLDGPEEIHDSNRRFAASDLGSFQVIMQNLRMIKTKYPEYIKKINFNMVIDPKNDFEKINELFTQHGDIILPNNLRSTLVDFSYCANDHLYAPDIYHEKKTYMDFVSYLNYWGFKQQNTSRLADEYIVFLTDKRMRRMKRRELPDIMVPGGPCVPALQRLMVDVHGKFFPCERVSESSECMKIGNLEEGLDFEKCKQLLNFAQLTEQQCKNCWAFWDCGLCAKAADMGTHLSATAKKQQCGRARASLEPFLRHYILEQELRVYYKKGWER